MFDKGTLITFSAASNPRIVLKNIAKASAMTDSACVLLATEQPYNLPSIPFLAGLGSL